MESKLAYLVKVIWNSILTSVLLFSKDFMRSSLLGGLIPQRDVDFPSSFISVTSGAS